MSVGLDPMIAVMNDIKVIDGYHNIYPLNYKIKFRKIIEKELEKNNVLKNYYDDWGNRIYAFYRFYGQEPIDPIDSIESLDYKYYRSPVRSSLLVQLCQVQHELD